MSRSLVRGASRGTKLARKLQRDMSAWPKKCWKKREVRGDERKKLENCGKKGDKRREGRRERGEKKKNWRKKEEKRENWRTKVEMRGQEKREGWEAQRAEDLLHDVANVVGMPCPVHLCTKSDHVRTASEKKTKIAGKIAKMHIWAERTLVRSPRQCNFWQPSTRERPGTDSARARVAQQLRKTHRKCHKTDRTQFSPLPKIIKKLTKTWQKRQIHDKNQQKYHKNKAKTTIWCPKLTNRGSYVSEFFQQARNKEFI